jgi:hypothetical protein
VTLFKKPPNSLEELKPKKPSYAQGPPIMSNGASPMTKIKSYSSGETVNAR